MAKHRTTDAAAGQGIFLSVNLQEQLLPGSFEHTLNETAGAKTELGVYDRKYKNDPAGASAAPPSVLLKLIFYGYYNGRVSPRKTYGLNKNNTMAKAPSGEMEIHWATAAGFAAGSQEAAKETLVRVPAHCNELGLTGGGNFAAGGLRPPPGASKDTGGTEKRFRKRLAACREMAEKRMRRHAGEGAQAL